LDLASLRRLRGLCTIDDHAGDALFVAGKERWIKNEENNEYSVKNTLNYSRVRLKL
jgi:hypothetical protein